MVTAKILNNNTDFSTMFTDLFYNYDCSKYVFGTDPDWSIMKPDNTDRIIVYNSATKQVVMIS